MFGDKFNSSRTSSRWLPDIALSTLSPLCSCQSIKSCNTTVAFNGAFAYACSMSFEDLGPFRTDQGLQPCSWCGEKRGIWDRGGWCVL